MVPLRYYQLRSSYFHELLSLTVFDGRRSFIDNLYVASATKKIKVDIDNTIFQLIFIYLKQLL